MLFGSSPYSFILCSSSSRRQMMEKNTAFEGLYELHSVLNFKLFVLFCFSTLLFTLVQKRTGKFRAMTVLVDGPEAISTLVEEKGEVYQ